MSKINLSPIFEIAKKNNLKLTFYENSFKICKAGNEKLIYFESDGNKIVAYCFSEESRKCTNILKPDVLKIQSYMNLYPEERNENFILLEKGRSESKEIPPGLSAHFKW